MSSKVLLDFIQFYWFIEAPGAARSQLCGQELSELLNVELAQIAWRLAKMGQIGMFDISPLDLAHAWRRVAATLINSSISELGTCLSHGSSCIS